MDVPERDVVGAVEDRERHVVEPALADLALHAGRRLDTGGEAVRDGDRPSAARRQVAAHEVHGVADGLRLTAEFDTLPQVAHDRGLEVGDAVEVDRTVRIVDRHRATDGERVGDDRDLFAQEGRLETQPGCGIVVARGHDDACAGVGERRERARQKRVAGRRRSRRVEHVARDDHDVDGVQPHLLDERTEHVGQGIERRVAVERPPDVPVGGVQDPHVHTVRRASDIDAQPGRGSRTPRRPAPSAGGDLGGESTDAVVTQVEAHVGEALTEHVGDALL